MLIYPSLNVQCTEVIGVSSNGRTHDSGSWNRGSNPCTPAIRPHRLVVKVITLSRWRHGFESRWGYQKLRTPPFRWRFFVYDNWIQRPGKTRCRAFARFQTRCVYALSISGRIISNSAPSSCFTSSTVPSWASMILLAIARPRP